MHCWPAATFDKLQRAQNDLARVVCQSPGRTDARPLLHSLHWLPVRQRVTYKLAVLTHKVRTTATPTYLSELVQTRAPPRALHSSMLRCSSFLAYTPNWPVALFLLLLHPPGTLYLLTYDYAKTFSLLNVNWKFQVTFEMRSWKPICSNSLSPPVLHQVPLYIFGPKGAIQIRYYYYYDYRIV